MAGDTCDVCDGASGGAFVGVGSIPGAPVSIAWCDRCIAQEAVPSWIFDHDIVFVADGDLTRLAEWARQRVTWVEGAYVSMADYAVRYWTPEKIAAEQARYQQHVARLHRPPEET